MSVPETSHRRATQRFALLCAIVVVGLAGYAIYSRSPAGPAADRTPLIPVDPNRLAAIRRAPHLLFRITALGPSYGRVGVVSLTAPEAPPLVTDLVCDRVHGSVEYGLCLQADRGVLTTYRAVAFDQRLAVRHEFLLPGTPSRTRVAGIAPIGASTVFVSGDSYAAGSFSTRTTIYDLEQNAIVGELESFDVEKGGQPFKRQDFNFWGVTFRDRERFYATLGTGGSILLVEGSVGMRRMRVIGTDVECPMLSPDGTRLAFKRRFVEKGRVVWRLSVLELATSRVIDLPENRNVDDQPEWLDDRHVLYGLPREGTGSADVWRIPADGAGAPAVFVTDAFSPAVVRVAAGLD